jgi:hypothetical protein
MLSTPQCSPSWSVRGPLEKSHHQTAFLYTLNVRRYVNTIHESTSKLSKKHYNQHDQRIIMDRKPSGKHILQVLLTAEPTSYTSPTQNSIRLS